MLSVKIMTLKFPFLLVIFFLLVNAGCHHADYTRPQGQLKTALDSIRIQDSMSFQDNLWAQDSLRVQDSAQFEKRFQKLESLIKLQGQNIKQLEKKIAQITDNMSKDSVENYQQKNLDVNKSSITEELNILALHALQYFLHPTNRGGGGKSYIGFKIPRVLEKTENARYKLTTLTSTALQIQALSTVADSWIAYLDIDENGTTSITYSGFDER
jgi:uncharacterized coiled-coil protein SlyX